jgi:RHS repeat-associated protein
LRCSGEQFDSDLGLYYLRARYYNPLTGRFMSRDPNDPGPFDSDGNPVDPTTLHKYLYAGGNPVNALDPSGRGFIEFTLQLVREVPGVTLVVGLTGGACALLGAEEAFGHSPLPEGPEKTLDDRLCAIFGAAAFVLGFLP